MPYSENSNLPDQVRSNASDKCQTIFRRSFNSIGEDNPDLDESELFKRAWGAMQDKCSKDDDGQWTTTPSGNTRRLVTNSVDASTVREVTEDGTRWFVAEDVPILQAQRLAGGYVPEDHVARSASEWSVPLTLNHPTDGGDRLVSANTDHGEQVTVGHAEAPSLDGDGRVTPDLRIDADRAEGLGDEGEQLVAALENDDGLEVSSQYFADDLPAGTYDGQFRHEVEGNLDPDSVALLPNDRGVCSLPDCGIAPDGGGAVTANADHLSATAAPTDDDGAPPDPDGGLIRQGLAALGAAFSANDEDATGAAPTANDCAGACDCGGGGDGEPNFDEWAESHSGADLSGNQSNMVDIDREMLVEAISKQSNLDTGTLEELGDDAIATIYGSVVKGDDEQDGGGGGAAQQQTQPPQQPVGNEGGDGGTVELAANAVPEAVADGEQSLGEFIDATVSEREQQSDKTETVDRIIANSSEYDDDDRDALLDTDGDVLDRIESGVETDAAGLPGRSGAPARATANAAGDADDVDTDDFGTGVIGNE